VGTYPILIIDEANALMAWSEDEAYRKELNALLQASSFYGPSHPHL
jgi:hypothetical protein